LFPLAPLGLCSPFQPFAAACRDFAEPTSLKMSLATAIRRWPSILRKAALDTRHQMTARVYALCAPVLDSLLTFERNNCYAPFVYRRERA
jgi:hypothetical protein